MPTPVTSQQVKQKALDLGFHKVGIADVDPPDPVPPKPKHPSHGGLQPWLEQGHHAGMAWMENPKRQDIRQIMPTVQSVICVALNYYTPHQHSADPTRAKISRYGWGRDYHRVLHKKLKAFARWLEEQDDEDRPRSSQVRYYADTGPIQDKVWAERAGLGWIAKNSNLITRDYGSWVFLGELLTSLELEPDRPFGQSHAHAPTPTHHCGTCTRCLEACPTQAITRPFIVDANRCIAYHTIENRAETLPDAIASNLQGWVAGCDICQDVCPWNQRFAQETDIESFQPYPWNIAPTLQELAEISEEDYNHCFPASALRRIKPYMMRRNAKANLHQFEHSFGENDFGEDGFDGKPEGEP